MIGAVAHQRGAARRARPTAPTRSSAPTRSPSAPPGATASTSCSTWRPASCRAASSRCTTATGGRCRSAGPWTRRATTRAIPGTCWRNLLARTGGGILPLGGRGEEFSGYKGYGLALMVDVLCGVLSGSAFGPDVDNVRGPRRRAEAPRRASGTSSWRSTSRGSCRSTSSATRLAALFAMLKDSRKALDKSVIYIHGEKEQVRARAARAVRHPARGERAGVADEDRRGVRRVAAGDRRRPPAPRGGRAARRAL